MGKSSPKAPTPPDPVATAQAQSTMNKESAVAQANLNRVNQYTPEGSTEYTRIGTNEDGTPQYRQDTKYSASQQALYDSNNAIAQALNGTAVNNIGRVNETQGRDFNFSGATPGVTNVNAPTLQTSIGGDFSAEAKKAQDAAYGQLASRLDPRFKQAGSDLEAKLTSQGISNNSEAYRREQDNLSRDRNDAYGQASQQAIAAGLDAQEQGFNQSAAQGAFANSAGGQIFGMGQANAALANQGRQQDINESTYLRNLPLNDIAALLGTGGGVQQPNFEPVSQVGVAAPDYAGLVTNNYNQQNQQYQQKMQNRSSGLGSIFGAIGKIGGAIAMSDIRTKENIRRVGSMASGIGTYLFNYIGDKAMQFGVMAQEVLGVHPEAVLNIDGILHVDYRKIW